MVRKSKIRFYFFSAVCLIIFGNSACGAFNSELVPATATPVPFVPPELPGPITQMDANSFKVEPKLIDDYLQNPGIGWQARSEAPSSLELPESVAYAKRREVAWSILNPAEGVYDWSALDKQMGDATAEGKQFSFRVYTMVGEDFNHHMVPNWVLEKGAILLSTGEPDYSNCVYQEEWGNFVNELVKRYDGNQNIAFIDISGYGNFNEWSWQDQQTEWDAAWEKGYLSGMAASDLFETLDGQARRRLADMFIGGSFDKHQCRLASGEISNISYSYPGFQKSQLVMPFAGIVQSSQYVFSRRRDIGFRYDCLGRDGEYILNKVGNLILKVWETAPVAFEFCKPEQIDVNDARLLLENGHGSIVHDNTWQYGRDTLKSLLKNVGYRYFLKDAILQVEGRTIALQMDWQNLGTAPSYPKIGQDFQLYFYLIDSSGVIVHKELVPANVYQWLPSESSSTSPQFYPVSYIVNLPFSFPVGNYFAGISVIDMRTRKPINLAFGGLDPAGWHLLAPLEIK